MAVVDVVDGGWVVVVVVVLVEVVEVDDVVEDGCVVVVTAVVVVVETTGPAPVVGAAVLADGSAPCAGGFGGGAPLDDGWPPGVVALAPGALAVEPGGPAALTRAADAAGWPGRGPTQVLPDESVTMQGCTAGRGSATLDPPVSERTSAATRAAAAAATTAATR